MINENESCIPCLFHNTVTNQTFNTSGYLYSGRVHPVARVTMNRNNEPSLATAFKRDLIVRVNKARLNAVAREGSLFLFITSGYLILMELLHTPWDNGILDQMTLMLCQEAPCLYRTQSSQQQL
jgi:hypothetical protein